MRSIEGDQEKVLRAQVSAEHAAKLLAGAKAGRALAVAGDALALTRGIRSAPGEEARGEGRLEAAAEKSAAELFAARMNALLDAGVMLDESLLAANQLSEDSQAIVSGAMYRVFGSFSRGVERRAGALS